MSEFEKPIRRERSPGETKRLAYERDCVNNYGNSDKAARKGIRRFKAASSRKLRRKGKYIVQGFRHSEGDDPSIESVLADATTKGLHPRKTKGSDLPLGIALAPQSESARLATSGKRDNYRKEAGRLNAVRRRRKSPE